MTKYVGARYMPKFMGLFDLTTSYEALSVVDNGLGTSYVSNIPVPAGTPLTDTEYWSVYGASSGAILDLQNRMDAAENDITDLQNDVLALSDLNYNFIRGKKILICGDSLSDETVQPPNWVEKLRDKNTALNLGATIENVSVGGSGWTSVTPGSGGLISVLSAVSDDFDIIILFAGINDFNSQMPLGSRSSADRTTLFGALYELNGVLHSKWPDAVVYWCTAPHTTIWTQAQKPIPHNMYRTIATLCCSRYNWLPIDTTNMPMYDIADYGSYYSDGIHPKTSYAQTLCDYIISKVAAGGSAISDQNNRYEITSFDGDKTGTIQIDVSNMNRMHVRFHLEGTWTANTTFTLKSDPDNGITLGSPLTIPTDLGLASFFFFPNTIYAKMPAASMSGWYEADFRIFEEFPTANCY